MNVFILIIVGFVALVIGFLLGRNRIEFSNDIVEKINSVLGVQNKELKVENELLRKKIFFFGDWLIRSYVEQHHRKKLALGDELIYSVDALEDLRNYAKDALDNFEKKWKSQSCNEQCNWIKEYLENLISNIDIFLDENYDKDFLDRENEEAFGRFFAAIETCMMFDREGKKYGLKTSKLSYWRPHVEKEDSIWV